MTKQDNRRPKRNSFARFLTLFSWIFVARAGLLINELDSSNLGPEFAEFIELINDEAQTVSAVNYTLALFGQTNTAETVIQLSNLTNVDIEPGGFALIANDNPFNLPFFRLPSFINDGRGGIALYLSEDPSQFFVNMPVTTGSDKLVDALVYTEGEAVDDLLEELTPGKQAIEVTAESTTSLSRCPGASAQLIDSQPSPGEVNLGCAPGPTTAAMLPTTLADTTIHSTTIRTTPNVTSDRTSINRRTTSEGTTTSQSPTTSDGTTTTESTTATTPKRTTTSSITTTSTSSTSTISISTSSTTSITTTTPYPIEVTTKKDKPWWWWWLGGNRRRQRRSRRIHRSWHHWG